VKRRLAHRLRAAFVDEMSDASFELQPHLEGAKLTMPPEMISKRNHFRLLSPHWRVVKRDLQKLLRLRLTFSYFDPYIRQDVARKHSKDTSTSDLIK
jgi:hypothetical protein